MVPHELGVVEIGVSLPRELVLCQNREHVDMRQVVVLGLLDRSRDDAGGVVDEPVNEKRVEILLDLNQHGLAGLRGSVDIEDGSLVVKYPRILWNSQGICFYGLVSSKSEHCIQKFHSSFRLRLVGHEHLENAVAERINVLVNLSVVCQVLGMLVHVLCHGDEFASIHDYLRPPTCGKDGCFCVFCKYKFLQRQNMTIALSVAFFLRMFVIDEIELKKPIWRNFAELSPFFLAETHKNNKK